MAPCNLKKSFERLTNEVRQGLAKEPLSGHVELRAGIAQPCDIPDVQRTSRVLHVLPLMVLSCTRVLVLGDELGLNQTGSAGRVRQVTSFVPSSVDAVDSVLLDDGATVHAFLGDGGLVVAVDGSGRAVAGATVGLARGVALTSRPTAQAWVARGQGLVAFQSSSDGTLVERQQVALPFEPRAVRRLSSDAVVAWNAARLAVTRADAGLFVSAPFSGELFDVMQVRAGLAFPDGGREGTDVLLALTSAGGFAAPLELPDRWHAVSFEKTGSTVLRHLVVDERTGRALGVSVAPTAGGALTLGALAPAPNRDHTWLSAPDGRVLQMQQNARLPCARPEALTGGPEPDDWRLFCRAPDGGLLLVSSMAVDVFEPLAPGLTAISGDARLVAGAGQALRVEANGDLVPLTPAMDRLREVFGRATAAVMVLDGLDAGLPTVPAVCATHGTPWFWCARGGVPDALRVRGQPAWALDSHVTAWDLDTGKPGSRVTDAPPRATAAAFIDALLVGADRELFRGVPLSKVTTLTAGPITSLTARSASEVYVVAGGLAFSVQEDAGWTASPLRWTDAVAVWSDGARGRLLLGDGSVRLLPTGQQVVAPTSDRFFSAESFCGQTFALSTRGLMRLVVSAEGAGWERVDLGEVPTASLFEGHLLAEESALLVLLPGVAPRLVEGFACAE